MITIISGTNRAGSNTRKIAGLVERIHLQSGAEVRLLDLIEMPAACFRPEAYATRPAEFAPMAQAVLESSGLVVVTPEYNGGFPGVLKYFIDLLDFPESFERRPVCFIGLAAGQWGALRPVEQLQQIFLYRNALVYPPRVFLPGIRHLLDENGALKDPALVERLTEQAAGFREFAALFRG